MSTVNSTPINGGGGSVGSPPSEPGTIGSRPASIRRSIDAGVLLNSENMATTSESSVVSPSANHTAVVSPPKLTQSYSANDIPTVKQNGTGLAGNANNHAQQHFHNHNASLGRIPAGAMPGRHNREMSGDNGLNNARDVASGYHSISTALHSNATNFGVTHAQSTAGGPPPIGMPVQTPPMPYSYYPPSYGHMNGNITPYTQVPLGMMQNLSLNGPSPQPVYTPQTFTTGYGPQYNPSPASRSHQPVDSQARVIQSRRAQDNDGKHL